MYQTAELEKPLKAVVDDIMAKTNNLNESSNPPATSVCKLSLQFSIFPFYQFKPCVFQQSSSISAPHLSTDDSILKPQLNFKDKINNNAGVFLPKIKEKPHSLKPLEITIETNELGDEEYCHPYGHELTNFTLDPKFLSSKSSVPSFKKVDQIPLVMVENEESLKLLIKDLSTKSVIGVDLEVMPHLFMLLRNSPIKPI